MIHTQNFKYVEALAPQDINGAATNGTAIDTLGFRHLDVILQLGAVGAAFDSAPHLEESDDNSTWTDITGGALSTTPATDADNDIYGISLPMGGARKRYIRLVVDAGASATLASGLGLLSRAGQAPSTAAEAGLAERLILT